MARSIQTIGFVAYMATCLVALPAVLLACSVIYRIIQIVVGFIRRRPIHQVDFFQLHVGICTWMLGIRHSFVHDKSTIAYSGTIILANHRSWCDFAFDTHLARATPISRSVAQFAMLVAGALSVWENRIVRFNRGRVTKEELYDRLDVYMQQNPHRNILLYPEGTRRRHASLASVEEAKSTLKPGLLWMIYQKWQYPVQVLVSSHKERAVDEHAWTIRLGVPIRTYAGAVLHPVDFESFEHFMDAIASHWFEAWNAVHSDDDDGSTNAVGRNTIGLESLQ